MTKKIRWYRDLQFRFELTRSMKNNEECLVVHNTMQKYTVEAVLLKDVYNLNPELRKIQFRNVIYLASQEVLLFFCEQSKQVTSVSTRASSLDDLKAHQFEFDFRVERELSR